MAGQAKLTLSQRWLLIAAGLLIVIGLIQALFFPRPEDFGPIGLVVLGLCCIATVPVIGVVDRRAKKLHRADSGRKQKLLLLASIAVLALLFALGLAR